MWRVIFTQVATPGHYFNALYLHKKLLAMSQGERDRFMTENNEFAFEEQSVLRALMSWAYSQPEVRRMSDETVELLSIAMAWSLTAPDNELRDCATRALVSLLQHRIPILVKILTIFTKIHDPHLHDRLFAAAYGCALRTAIKHLPELCRYVYHFVFASPAQVYPHVLVRHYAKSIIEYASYHNIPLQIDPAAIHPPYQSVWPDNIPPMAYLEEQYNGNKEFEEIKDTIIEFLEEEFNGLEGFDDDDFAQSFLLSRILDYLQFSPTNTYSPDSSLVRKYLIMASHELEALVNDHVEMYFLYCIREFRVFDPTILLPDNRKAQQENKYWWTNDHILNWEVSPEEWLDDADDFPEITDLIELTDHNHEQWLVLEGEYKWEGPLESSVEESTETRKQMFIRLGSYLVKEKDFKKIRKYADDFRFGPYRWVEIFSQNYEPFIRECYWSPMCYPGGKRDINTLWSPVVGKNKDKVGPLLITYDSLEPKRFFDYSWIYPGSLFVPSAFIAEKMRLQLSLDETQWTNPAGEIICKATNNDGSPHSFLMIKKQPFMKFLKINHLKIIWSVIGHKNVEGGNYGKQYNDLEATATLDSSGSIIRGGYRVLLGTDE